MADTTDVTDLTDQAAKPPSARPGPEVLVIAAHPQLEHSRINRRLMRAAAGGAATVEVRDLYALYPDYLIDIEAEQALLESARLVVWQHPIHWYSMPPLMKLWVDEVLAFGWAYGPGGNALRGKDLWLVATTGGPEESYHPDSYNRYVFDAFLPPYEQTAALCGMRFLPPLLLHGAHRASEAEVAAHVGVYTHRLASHPNWPELDELLYGLACAVPEDARPDDEPAAPTGRAPGRSTGQEGARLANPGGPHPLGGSAAAAGGREAR
ncbi:MAG: NAD(P)H-dependent oxidoreductase [Bacteriovorax sp.]|nr:NAD(P)H-dependent oxidoreductase [Rhizobacter sp.]